MLWPNDEQQRVRAQDAAGVKHLQETATSIAKGTPGPDVTLPKELIFELGHRLTNAPNPSDVVHQATPAFARGVLAGRIFLGALADQMIGKREGLQAIKAEVAQRHRGQEHFEELSAATIEKLIWGVYRPVSHLWAACGQLAVETGGGVVPCRLADLPLFLAVAESLRRDGESCRLRQSKTLLDPSKTWRVPADLQLPVVKWGAWRTQPTS